VHAQASSGQRGGWLSSHRRKLAVSDHGTIALDANQVFRKLYVGSGPPPDRRLPLFSAVALCAVEIQPEETAWDGRIIRARLHDHDPTQTEILQAVTAARQVAEELRRGGRVLVTCAMGRNRSAWVAAMAILMVRPKAHPNAVIRAIRQRRDPACLSNGHFVAIIKNIWTARTPPR
jgi:hypothetical protein